jgi:hypothetical protein
MSLPYLCHKGVVGLDYGTLGLEHFEGIVKAETARFHQISQHKGRRSAYAFIAVH